MTSEDDQLSRGISAVNHALDVTQRERGLLAEAPNVARDGELVRAEVNSGDTSAAMFTSWEIGQAIPYDPLLAEEEVIERVALQKAIEQAELHRD